MATTYEVRQGDCISSIAAEFGLKPETIWDYGENADLKKNRKDPNILLEGDIVVVPDKRERHETRAVDARHRFVRKGWPEHLRIVLLDHHDEPRRNCPYVLTIDGVTKKGSTDGKGMLDEPIVPNAQQGLLVIGKGFGEQRISLSLGHLNPITEKSGVQMRLANMGYELELASDADQDDEIEPSVQALLKFQEQLKQELTGEPDGPTRGKLKDKYGS